MTGQHQTCCVHHFYNHTFVLSSFQHFRHPFLFYYIYCKKSAQRQSFSTSCEAARRAASPCLYEGFASCQAAMSARNRSPYRAAFT
jgi:hypothetical protein